MTDAIWRPTVLPIDPSTVPDVGVAKMRVTSPYGNRISPINGAIVFHDGLDIGNAREGDQLVADTDGMVAAAGALGWPWSQPTALFPSGNYGGFMVAIDHGAWVSIYAHMQPTLQVKAGEQVKVGQPIGKVGATGAASVYGAHCHYGHITTTVANIIALGAATKPTRDPWTVIDPTGAMPTDEPTWAEQVQAQLIAARKAKPKAARRWVTRTDMTQEDDGKILTRFMRQRAELAMLREAPKETP